MCVDLQLALKTCFRCQLLLQLLQVRVGSLSKLLQSFHLDVLHGLKHFQRQHQHLDHFECVHEVRLLLLDVGLQAGFYDF
jgi:hypothetical protein